MAFNSDNLQLLVTPFSRPGVSLWSYSSTSDSSGTVVGTGYFASGSDYGLKVDDLMLVNLAGTGSIHVVTSSSASSTGYNPPDDFTIT